MTNTEIILEVLDDIQPKVLCDDCLSYELQIKPRQQVNQIARRLESQGKVIRQKGICPSCNKLKLTNAFVTDNLPNSSDLKIHESTVVYSIPTTRDINMDIEKLRTQIVWICKEIWSQNESSSPPRSISKTINLLKLDNNIPSHQANMMLTVCSLRNIYVYESLALGQREYAIAANAWSIISDWWSNLTNMK